MNYLYNFPFIVVAILIAMGFYAMMFKRNLIKIVIGLNIVESAVNLFLIALGYRKGAVAPIYTNAPVAKGAPAHSMVLPTPQALTLTAIVIGVATTAMILSFVVQIGKHYGTIDAKKARRLKG
ncbi:MAG: cation:proton antiporter [Thermoplasmata archaeon]|nr:MAG: cation:proton antiporter [Thermoplasmata archaeon]